MNMSEDRIKEIVREVLKGVDRERPVSYAPTLSGSQAGSDGVFATMDEAVNAAHGAFLQLKKFGVEDRAKFVSAIRRTGLERKEELSRMVFEETKMGRYAHKVQKHVFAAQDTPGTEDLETRSWSGKNGLCVEEYAPFGVIGAVTPSTHPSETVISNLIMMVAGGNSVVFSPHPTAKKVSAHVVRVLNRALVSEGAPANLAVCVAEPTIQTAEEMFHHPKVAILSITGGPGVVQAAMRSNKKVVAAGPGNPPVVVDESADLKLAAEMITKSAAFDNNVLCFAEKEIFVAAKVFDRFMDEMKKAGNVRLDPDQIERLAGKAFEKKKHLHVLNRELAGRNANVIAAAIGLRIGEDVPLLFGETSNDHIFVQEEQLMPFLPVIRCRDCGEAVERALIAEHGYGHSAGIYTADMKAATAFARRANTSIFVINGGHHQGDGGPEGEGTLSFTIATPTGEAITRPRHFCRTRRIMIAGTMRFV